MDRMGIMGLLLQVLRLRNQDSHQVKGWTDERWHWLLWIILLLSFVQHRWLPGSRWVKKHQLWWWCSFVYWVWVTSSIPDTQPMLNQNFLFPVDCIWGAWTEWGTCSASCRGGANGTEVRKRSIEQAAEHGGVSCGGQASESRICDQFTLCGKWHFG